MDRRKGITLIALIITVVILLILSGVAIQSAIDSDGLFGKTASARQVTKQKTELEAITMAVCTAQLNGYGIITDENLNNELKSTFSDDVSANKVGTNWYYKGYIINEYGNVEEHNQRLPIEYQEVDFIRNSGTQYIDTGVVPTANYKFYLKFTDLKASGSNYVMGARKTTSSTGYAGVSGTNAGQNMSILSTNCITPNNYRVAGYTYIVEGVFNSEGTGTGTIKCLDTGDIYTGTQTTQIPSTLETNITLFAYRAGQIHGAMRVYECKQWINDELVRDFIPCYRKSDDVVGLYDLVNNVFYTNVGSGSFIKGSDV